MSRTISASPGQAIQLSAGATLAISRGLGGDLTGYRAVRSRGGFVARNARQGLTASFGGSGATISMRDGARAGIALQAIGFGSALHSVALAQPLARANRVEYRRGATTEWFANGPAGVEQGFTVANEPAGTNNGALTLALAVSGTLTARPRAAGGVVLVGADGKPVLHYGDLSVTDARGRALPAHMAVQHGRISISIDARGARYPLTVDPLLNQIGELYESAGATEDMFGGAIAASGSTVVVGETLTEVGGHYRAGAAYVFTEGAGGWASATQVGKLVASNPESEESFGGAVAISGRTIVVGAPGRKSGSGVDAGGAYVYNEPAKGWGETPEQTQAAELINSEDVTEYEFGLSVAITGETIVVGTPRYRNYEHSATPAADGAVFLFQEPAGGWADEPNALETQSATLVPHESEVEEDGNFGYSVAIGSSGGEQIIVVGAPGQPVGSEPSKYRRGIVFIFTEPAGGWVQSGPRYPQVQLTASDATEFASLGQSVSMSVGVIAAAASRATVGGVETGATYVFTPPVGGWAAETKQTQAAKLTATGATEAFGYEGSVAIEGDTIVSGAQGKNAYLFAMPSSGWSGEIHQSAEFAAKIWAVGLSGGDALMGALTAKPPSGTGAINQGAVDVVPFAPFVNTGGTSGGSEATATVEGTVNPDQTTLSSCHFQYGASSSYGQEASCSSFPTTGATSSPVSATLTGLTPGTIYHYRVLATNQVNTSYGEDKTFTTPAAANQGEGPESTTTTTTPTATTPTTTTTTTTPTTPPNVVGPTVVVQPSPALACTTAQVALINVVQQGSHVEITGAARLVLAGKRVSIKFLATHKVVATATIAANGTFSTSAPLPPAKMRETNLARYEATVGALRSLNLKLDRRMYMTSATRSGAHVLLSGYVTGSFKAGAVVKILLRVTCSSEKVIAKVKLNGAGKFNATVPAPTGAASQIAVYRGTTTVLKDGHLETTFTLPTPPSN